MKKIIFIATTLLCGCSQEVSQETRDMIESDFIQREVYKFEYKEHKYIQFGPGKYSWGIHDPDCPCLIKENK